MASAIPAAIPVYADPRGGLLNGVAFIGAPNLDPETNPIAVFWDAAGTHPAAQPLSIVAGMVMRAGAPSQVFAGQAHSVTVKDSAGRLVVYAPQNLAFDSLTAGLSGPEGAGMLGFSNALVYPLGTVGARLAFTPLVTDQPYNAVGDGVTDNADAFVQAGAATTGTVVVPEGDYLVQVTPGNAAGLFNLLRRIRVDGVLVYQLPLGVIPMSQQVVVNSPDAQRIQVLGAATVTAALGAVVGVTGAAKSYSVNIGVSSSAGVSVGDYALIRTDVTGTGDFYAHVGGWRVTAVNSGGANRVTLRNTHHGAAFPTNTVTGGTVVFIRSRIEFSGSDGFRFEGGQPLGALDRVALVGDYTVATAAGTTGTHGIVTATPLVADGGDSNATFNAAGNAALGPNVVVSAWGEQGIVVSGRGTLVANYVASSSNRKRGWYAEGGHIRAKLGSGSGNGEDGYVSDTTGFVQAALSVASGNGLSGFWSTNGSFLAASASRSTGNLSHGYEARGLARLGGDSAIALGNVLDGFASSDGAGMDADSADAIGNGRHGFSASVGSIVDANNADSTGNAQFGARVSNGGIINLSGAGSTAGNTSGPYSVSNGGDIFQTDGLLFPALAEGGTLRVHNTGRTHFGDVANTSIGDTTFGIDGVTRVVLKVAGVLHPSTDNTQAFGRVTERWSQGFIRQLHPGAGAVIWTSGAGTPEGAVTAPVGSMFTRSDGGAGVTLYVKESGSGNTGWAAK